MTASMAAGAAVEAPPRHERLVLAVILAVGAVLRAVDLGDGLWYDEIGTLVRYVRRPLAEIVTRFDTQNQHMLFSILAHASVRAFGESAWALRLPAAVFGVLSLWATWWLGVRVTSRLEALVAAGLLAVSSHHVWFSQDARGYSMLLFFTLVSTRLFIRLLETDADRGTIAGYVVMMALACYTQVAGGFVLIAHGLVWLWKVVAEPRIPARGAMKPLGAMAGAGVATLLLYAPVLPAMTRTLGGPKATGGATEWKSLGWFVAEAARGLARGVPGGWIALLAALAVVLLGLWSYWKQWRVIALLLVVPGLVTAAVMLVTAHNLWPRLFFFAAGFAALIAVRGGFRLCALLFKERGPLVATAGAALVALASALTVPRVWQPKQDFGAALAWVNAARTSGDTVVTVDMTRLPYRDYYRAAWLPADSLPDLVAAERAAARTWVLVTFPERLQAVDTATWRHLSSRYAEARRFGGTVQGGTIVVMRSQ